MQGVVSETVHLAQGREGEVLAALGIAAPARGHIRCPLNTHPDRHPSWRFDFRASRFHCTCSQGDLLDLAVALGRAPNLVEAAKWVCEVLGFEAIGQRRAETPAERRAREVRIAEARRQAEALQRQRERKDAEDAARALTWMRGPFYERVMNVAGSPAETYLRSRGISLAAWPFTLGFVQAYGDDRLPAMVAFFGIPTEPEPGVLSMRPEQIVGIHLTFLQPDGSGKVADRDDRSKIIVGRGHSLPIVLAPPNDGLGLIIAEGIEDALSWHQVTRLGAWAAGTANRLPGLAEQIPAYIECATIIEDPDPAGRTYSARLAQALAGRNVEVLIRRGGVPDGA
jgi:hypothetical protein